jgi:hypothetical protein
LFGPKVDWLPPEEQEQLTKLNQDLEAEAQGPGAASDGVLDEDDNEKEKKRRHPPRQAPSPAGTPRDRDRHDRTGRQARSLMREDAGTDR